MESEAEDVVFTGEEVTELKRPLLSPRNYLGKKGNVLLTLVCLVVLTNLFVSSQAYRNLNTLRIAITKTNPGHTNGTDRPLLKPREIGIERSGDVSAHVLRGLAKVNVHVYNDVCLELLEPPIKETMKNKTYNIDRKVVVYNSKNISGTYMIKVSTSTNAQFLDRSWRITFSRSPIPGNHTRLNRTALFLTQVKPSNLHHFWEEQYQHIYSLARRLHLLGNGQTIQLLYRHAPEMSGDDFSRYEMFYRTLNLHSVRDAYFRVAAGTCFRQAVFGHTNFATMPRADTAFAVHHVLTKHNIDRKKCGKYFVSLVQRQNRVILNMDAVVRAVVSLGFNNTEVVRLEKLSPLEQLRKAACSRVIVGTQGAGLQWAIFMPLHSLLVEITWPTRHWPGYYGPMVAKYKMKHAEVKVDSSHVYINWDSYEKFLMRSVPQKERDYLLTVHSHDIHDLDNIWKWADVEVDIDKIKRALLIAKRKIIKGF